MKKAILATALLAASILPIHAQIFITEAAPWSSGNSPIAADWFELTNTGASAVNISNWRVDDDSNAFASALTLTGITNIGAGESVIFLEGSAATVTAFKTNWFGANPPLTLQVGFYSGAGIGFGTGGDQINIFNGSGTKLAGVTFGASDGSVPYQTFDNSARLNYNGTSNPTISLLSTTGVNRAFAAVNNSANEIGSPGAIPEPSALLSILGGAAMLTLRRRRSA